MDGGRNCPPPLGAVSVLDGRKLVLPEAGCGSLMEPERSGLVVPYLAHTGDAGAHAFVAPGGIGGVYAPRRNLGRAHPSSGPFPWTIGLAGRYRPVKVCGQIPQPLV